MRRINISLTKPGSITNAIKELEEYKKEVRNKTELFLSKLIDAGIDTAKSNCGEYSGMIVFEKELIPFKDGCEGLLIATDGQKVIRQWMRNGTVVSAEVSPLLMSEFGSGWLAHVMSTKDYRANDLNVGQGTFPEQIHAFDRDGWWWVTPDGERHHSIGEAPTYPMYSAVMAVLVEINSIAKEVFK